MNNFNNSLPRLHPKKFKCPCNEACYPQIVAVRKDKESVTKSILIDFFHIECKSINNDKLMELGIVVINNYGEYHNHFFGRCQGIERFAYRLNWLLDNDETSFNKSIWGLIKQHTYQGIKGNSR